MIDDRKTGDNFWKGFGAGILSVALVVVVGVLIFNISYFGTLLPQGLTMKESGQALSKLNTMMQLVDSLYLEEFDRQEMLNAAYEGFIDSLGDRYSRYYTEEEYQSFKEDTSGSYSGVGLTVSMDEESGRLVIVEIQKGSPAEGTEIRPGDVLMAVNGQDVGGMDQNSIVTLIKGKEGSEVELTFCHEGEEENFSERLIRKEIETETVRYAQLEDGIGYMVITGFDEVTVHQYEDALSALQEEGIRGLVIDVRDNPGGRLDVVVDILDMILPKGIITYTEDKWGERETFSSDEECLDLPLAILINGNSASASEIFAGAIKDYELGALVGTTTFGKGIVQRTTAMADGSAVKLTMARYYTPKGEYIHGVGIVPDIEIDLPSGIEYFKDLPYEDDVQLQTAVEAVKTRLGE